jgi:cytochrome o ubiquinol oxidase operon protein cyoD
MSQDAEPLSDVETAPGDEASEASEPGEGLTGYIVGLALASLLTVVAFLLPTLDLVWQPSLPVALAVLAIAQMGVHLVFFLHVTTGPDNVNNVLALAFGLLVVFLVIAGSLWIMQALNASMMARDGMGM